MNFHERFDNKKVIVTGGAGFIGSCLVRRLCERTRASVLVIDNFGLGSNPDSIPGESVKGEYTLCKTDITNEAAVNLIFEDFKPDIVYHLAAESHVDRSIKSPRSFINSNIVGTFCLLEAALRHYQTLENEKKQQFRFHHVSTDEVYGSLRESGSFDERSPYKPSSPYSASKAASDHLVRAWYTTYGLPVTISNCSNNYGPWQDPEKFIPKVILAILKDQEIPLYGDGSNVRDWLFVEDHVDALLRCAAIGYVGQTYCIGGRTERSNIQVIMNILHILESLGCSVTANLKYVQDRLGHDYRYAINPQNAESILGWGPKHSFDQGLKKTIDWYAERI